MGEIVKITRYKEIKSKSMRKDISCKQQTQESLKDYTNIRQNRY